MLLVLTLTSTRNSRTDQTEELIISTEDKKIRVTLALIEYLHGTASEDYSLAVIEWWVYSSDPIFEIANGPFIDRWEFK